MDVEFLSPLLNLAADTSSSLVGDDSGVGLVLGSKGLQISNIADDEWKESRWEHEASLDIRSETSRWVSWGATELLAVIGIDTPWLVPGLGKALEAIALDTGETLGALMDDLLMWGSSGWH